MVSDLSDSDIARLARLEESLWRAETRNSPGWMEGILAPDFQEIGASGLVHGRADVVAPHDGPIRSRPLIGFRARMIGETIALARYRSATENDDGTLRTAERTSLWRREGADWKLVFHQGTLSSKDDRPT